MERQIVNGPGLPASIGPYSHGVRAGGFLFVAGQAGINADGDVAGPSFAEQARQAFKNLDAVLRAGGSRPELVVNTTVLVADQSWFGELNELFAEFFPSEPPARMTMQVPLPRGLLISIGCIAVTAD